MPNNVYIYFHLTGSLSEPMSVQLQTLQMHNANTSPTLRKYYFCICQKAQISSVNTQLDQGLCFFAILIENFPALIERAPKILNLKLEIVFMKHYAPNH